MSINEIRKKIDSLDDEISSLLLKRLDLIERIKTEKKKANITTLDEDRERSIIERLVSNKTAEQKEFIEKIYREVFKASREYQDK